MSEPIEMIIDIKDGKIIQSFGVPQPYVEYDSQNARAIACHLADLAEKLSGNGEIFEDDTIPGDHAGLALKKSLIDRHRKTLTTRVTHILRSIRKDIRRTDKQAAQEIVDICIGEFF